MLAACFDFDATTAGGPLVDAARDVAPMDSAASSDGGAYCASQARPTAKGALFFCADFDEGRLPGGFSVFRDTSGTLALTTAAWVSRPNAVKETLLATDGGQSLDVSLRQPLPLPLPPLPSTLAFGFSVEAARIDPAPNAALVLGAVDFLDDAGDRYSLQLSISVQGGAATVALQEQSVRPDGAAPFQNHPLPVTQTLTASMFARVELRVQWTAPTTASAVVLYDGAPSAAVPLSMTVAATSLQIGIGTSYVGEPSPGGVLRYDNALLTAM